MQSLERNRKTNLEQAIFISLWSVLHRRIRAASSPSVV